MFSFAYPYLLFLLASVALFGLLYLWARAARRRKLRRFGKPAVLKELMPEVSPYKPVIKILLELGALAMIVIALARPWGAVRSVETSKEGIEVMICVDASNSMLASSGRDGDGSQRMRVAKNILERLVNNLDNDRVGLIYYAAEAYSLVPITTDYISAKTFLNSIDPSAISAQGTNIAAAVQMASGSFSNSKEGIGRSIILITDAEELEDEEQVEQAVKLAAKNGIQVNVVGVGSSVPVTIPYGDSFLIDPQTGQPARTVLNEDLATKIARDGNGIYVNASNREALSELMKQLDTVKKSALKTNIHAVHDELYSVFLWIALGLLVIDIFMLDRKIGWLSKIRFFSRPEPAARKEKGGNK